MAENKKNKSAWFYITIILVSFFVWQLIDGWSFDNSNKDSYSNSYWDNNPSNYDSGQNYGGNLENSQKISLNGVSLIKTLNYPYQTISLNLNGVDNIITITKETIISEINLNGLRNTLNLCSTHSPIINQNGITNQIIYSDC